MLDDLTMLANLPVSEAELQKAKEEDKAADRPVVPPDDPHRHHRRGVRPAARPVRGPRSTDAGRIIEAQQCARHLVSRSCHMFKGPLSRGGLKIGNVRSSLSIAAPTRSNRFDRKSRNWRRFVTPPWHPKCKNPRTEKCR